MTKPTLPIPRRSPRAKKEQKKTQSSLKKGQKTPGQTRKRKEDYSSSTSNKRLRFSGDAEDSNQRLNEQVETGKTGTGFPMIHFKIPRVKKKWLWKFIRLQVKRDVAIKYRGKSTNILNKVQWRSEDADKMFCLKCNEECGPFKKGQSNYLLKHLREQHIEYYLESKSEDLEQRRMNVTNQPPVNYAPQPIQDIFNHNVAMLVAEENLALSIVQSKAFQRLIDYSVRASGGTFRFRYPSTKKILEIISIAAMQGKNC